MIKANNGDHSEQWLIVQDCAGSAPCRTLAPRGHLHVQLGMLSGKFFSPCCSGSTRKGPSFRSLHSARFIHTIHCSPPCSLSLRWILTVWSTMLVFVNTITLTGPPMEHVQTPLLRKTQCLCRGCHTESQRATRGPADSASRLGWKAVFAARTPGEQDLLRAARCHGSPNWANHLPGCTQGHPRPFQHASVRVSINTLIYRYGMLSHRWKIKAHGTDPLERCGNCR